MKMCLCVQAEEKEDEEEEALAGEVKASPNADTTILFVKGEGDGRFKELATAKSPTCERLSELKCDLVSLQTFQPTTSSSFCSASPTRDRRILWWSLWTPRSVTLRYGSFPSQAQRCVCCSDLDSVWSPAGLPVLHPELHRAPARHRGPLRPTGHL